MSILLVVFSNIIPTSDHIAERTPDSGKHKLIKS